MTSTATLQAALDVMGNKEPSIGYSVAYPFGVIGPILCFYFMTRQVKPKFPPKPQRFHMAEITLERLPDGRNAWRIHGGSCPQACRSPACGSSSAICCPIADMRAASGDGC